MSFITKTFHNIKCDGCGALCDAEMWHDSPDTLLFVAQDQHWRQIGDKHYCPDCWQREDDAPKP